MDIHIQKVPKDNILLLYHFGTGNVLVYDNTEDEFRTVKQVRNLLYKNNNGQMMPADALDEVLVGGGYRKRTLVYRPANKWINRYGSTYQYYPYWGYIIFKYMPGGDKYYIGPSERPTWHDQGLFNSDYDPR